MTNTTLYFIDGIAVTRRIFERRQLFGEHPSSQFTTMERKLSEREQRKLRLLQKRQAERQMTEPDKPDANIAKWWGF